MSEANREAILAVLRERLSDADLHTIIFNLGDEDDNYGGPPTPKNRRLENLFLEYERRGTLSALISAIQVTRLISSARLTLTDPDLDRSYLYAGLTVRPTYLQSTA